MAARNTKWTPDIVRQRIRTTQLIRRLQDHVLKEVPMSKTQVSAAGLLLKKTLPDMVAQTVTQRPLEGMDENELLSLLAALRSIVATQTAGAGAVDQAELPKAH